MHRRILSPFILDQHNTTALNLAERPEDIAGAQFVPGKLPLHCSRVTTQSTKCPKTHQCEPFTRGSLSLEGLYIHQKPRHARARSPSSTCQKNNRSSKDQRPSRGQPTASKAPRATKRMTEACNQFYVMLFDKDSVGIASRCSEIKPFVAQQQVKACSASLIPNVPVKLPPRPSSGIMNVGIREELLQEYRKNPLVFTVEWTAPHPADTDAASRHFLGFGFSKEMPYFPPGTILNFTESGSAHLSTATITGMAAAFGQRNNEYAIILSLDRPVHPDAISAFIESYNITEIDGGDDGLCGCLANIIRKYTYTVGDVDPQCASTEAMESAVASKFQNELERMFESVQAVLASSHPHSSIGVSNEELDRRTRRVTAIFKTYKETLFMQMRHQPLGTREWIQMFESYMSFAASEQGLGFLDFVLY